MMAEKSSLATGSVLLVSDLDRTLIYSGAALELTVDDADAPTVVSVEFLDGRPQSFMTMEAVLLLADLHRRSIFVPTTTRTLAQYRRVNFPGISPSFAITSNGGNILIEGEPDQDWMATMRAAIATCGADLSEVQHELKKRSQPEWVLKRRVGDGLFCYLVVDLSALPEGFVRSWTDWCAERSWVVSVQGRKIYSIPEPLRKERAVAEVARRVGAERVWAAGDGALDAGFLAAADGGIRPPHGELALADWQSPNVVVGSRRGVLAAEDITRWFADRLGV